MSVHEDDEARDVELQVALLLRLADHNRRSNPGLDGTLERSAYLALRHLASSGPSGINDIATHLRLDASTVTRQVLAMETAGLVERARDENDGRRSIIAATPAGRAALLETRDARAAVYDELLGSWTFEDRAHLATLLRRLNEALDDRAAQR